METSSNILTARGSLWLSQKENSPQRLLFNIDFQWQAGDKIILRGDSGSGKSLFLRAATGLYKDPNLKIQYYAKQSNHTRIAYLPQNIPVFAQNVSLFLLEPFLEKWRNYPNRIPDRSLRQWILIKQKPLSVVHEAPFRKFYQIALFYLKLFGFSEQLMKSNLSHLSGGEAFIVRFIRNILLKKQIFLIDESHSQLDQKKRRIFYRFLSRKKVSFILVSHDTKSDASLSELKNNREIIITNDTFIDHYQNRTRENPNG